MSQQYNYKDWQNTRLTQIKTKQQIDQLSKLYIIAHEKVKTIIRKCQIDLHYDPVPDCQREVQLIHVILRRLADRSQDQYLMKIDPKMLDRYESNFADLMELLKVVLATDFSKRELDINALKRVCENRKHRKGEFSLRNELRKSESRMVRTKSGHRITKDTLTTANTHKKSDFMQLDEAGHNIEIDDAQKHEEQFQERKKNLEKTMNGHFDKKGFTLDFKKKYDKLDEYLRERKEFSDLIFSQKYYDEMIAMSKTRKNETKIQQKKDPDLNKLFPQFNIKTKYMKKQVKQNILQVIFDVKKELLKQYHDSNVAKMRETNDGGMINLEVKHKNSKCDRLDTQQTTLNQKTHTRFRSTNRLNEKRKYSLGNLRGHSGTGITWRKHDDLIQQEKKVDDMFRESRMPNYNQSKV